MTSHVIHVSFSQSGGTGSVAKILSDQQNVLGMKSQLVTVIETNLRESPLSSLRHTLSAGVDEYAIRRQKFSAPISLFRDGFSVPPDPLIKSAKVVHLHGINGALSLPQLAKSWPEKRIVWTLHDMNPFTGTCHYSLDCRKFTSDCSGCPAVKIPFRGMVANSLAAKKAAVSVFDDLRLVAPSAWLAQQAATSTGFSDHNISVIPNPIADDYFSRPTKGTPAKAETGLRVVIVAKNLLDPVKNVAMAVKTFLSLFPDEAGANPELVLVGQGGEGFVSHRVKALGALTSEEIIAELDEADVLVVPSLAENAPLVIAEAAARGVKPLVANIGGMPEMVRMLGQGNTFDSASGLSALLELEMSTSVEARRGRREKIQEKASSHFSPQAAANNYAKIYS